MDSASETTDVFERLKQAGDPENIKAKAEALKARDEEQFLRAQQRLTELVSGNSTQPVKFNTIRVHGAPNTRDSFLQPIIQPAFAKQDLTLKTALAELQKTVGKLQHYDLFQNIVIHLDAPNQLEDPLPLDAVISVKERSRLTLKTGTDLGNTEGSAYGQLTYRNLFGGAEALNLTGSLGTRTRSAYQATLSGFLGPFTTWEVTGLNSSRDNTAYASHIELNKGATAALRWGTHIRQEVAYEGIWRQVTSLHEDASPTVRQDAGNSIKSAITHTILSDTRDSSLLPSQGVLLKLKNQIAGRALGGTVSHWKSEAQAAIAIPISRVTFASSIRGGLLYPFNGSSSITDRFQLGGATDVRGFHLGGLGPHSGRDALGGNAYIAGSTALLFPFPRAPADSGLRLQTFVNGGRLVSDYRDILDGPPSLAAGVGIVYGHPVARFELNFCLPIIMRKGAEGSERARKGIQFGIGIEFL